MKAHSQIERDNEINQQTRKNTTLPSWQSYFRGFHSLIELSQIRKFKEQYKRHQLEIVVHEVQFDS